MSSQQTIENKMFVIGSVWIMSCTAESESTFRTMIARYRRASANEAFAATNLATFKAFEVCKSIGSRDFSRNPGQSA